MTTRLDPSELPAARLIIRILEQDQEFLRAEKNRGADRLAQAEFETTNRLRHLLIQATGDNTRTRGGTCPAPVTPSIPAAMRESCCDPEEQEHAERRHEPTRARAVYATAQGDQGDQGDTGDREDTAQSGPAPVFMQDSQGIPPAWGCPYAPEGATSSRA